MFSFRWKLFINTRKLWRIECLSHNNIFSDIWQWFFFEGLADSFFVYSLPDISLIIFVPLCGVLSVTCLHYVSKDDLNSDSPASISPVLRSQECHYPRDVTLWAMVLRVPLVKSHPHYFCCPYIKSEEHTDGEFRITHIWNFLDLEFLFIAPALILPYEFRE